jgi:LruC domain-containing protein
MLIFSACKEDEISDDGKVPFVGGVITPPTETTCGASTNTKLINVDNLEIGTVVIGNDIDSLYITVNTKDQWFINETHIFIGEKRNVPIDESLSIDKENFPIKSSHDPVVQSYQFTMSLKDFSACEDIIVHVSAKRLSNNGDLLEEKSAWLDGSNLEGIATNGFYVNYCLNECIVKYPVENVATMAFEDLYPERGDADYNDFIAGMEARIFYKGPQVNRVEMTFKALARGAGYNHTFLLGLPIEGTANISIKRYMNGDVTEPYEVEELTNVGGADLRVEIFPSTKLVLPPQEGGHTNTREGSLYIEPAKTTVSITFVNAKLLMPVPFDPILRVEETGMEIHIPEITQDIDADGDGLKDYWEVREGIFPFGIVMYQEWLWPMEQVNISRIYPNFEYVYSSGIFRPIDPNWYQTPEPNSRYFQTDLFN